MPHTHRQDNWWKRRTKLERRMTIVALGSLSLALVLLIGLILFHQYGEPSGVCLTAGCIHAASELLKNIDESVSPCDNFYMFSCGNFRKNAHIPDNLPVFSPFSEIMNHLDLQIRTILEKVEERNTLDPEIHPFRLVKTLYKACMNKEVVDKDGLVEAQTLLNSLGGWPVLDKNWDANSFEWSDMHEQLQEKGLTIGSYLRISAGVDSRHSNIRIINIDQAGFGLRKEYLKKGPTDKLVHEYYQLMVDTVIMFGATELNAHEQMREVLNFEIDLAKHAISKNEVRDSFEFYHIMTLEELQNKHSQIPWIKLFRIIFPSNVEYPGDTQLLIQVPTFVEALETALNITSPRVQANYLLWRAVFEIYSYLPQNFQDRHLKFKQVVDGVTESLPRWKECVSQAQKLLPISLGAMYVRTYFTNDVIDFATELVKYVIIEFKNIIKTLDWMDNNTRHEAMAKANAIVGHIAYASELLDDSKLEDLTAGLEFYENVYLQAYLNINRFKTNQSNWKLIEPVNKTSWKDHSYPVEVNAFYDRQDNCIILPAAILQGVFFNKDRPRYLNYGAIGTVIGHEITHAFDDQGRQFDKNGDLIDWWQKETKKAFIDKAQCIVKQYDNYVVSEISMNVSGLRTQGENIADNGGTKQAYLAYNSWVKNNGAESKLPGLKYTPRQLFWISAAQIWCSLERPEYLSYQVTTDVHTPAEYRIIGTFSNAENFARDFGCPYGSNMNPKHKCTIW